MKKRSLWVHVSLLGSGLLILFLLLYYSGFILKDCGTDKQCFQARFSRCMPTSLDFARNNNVYRYELKNFFGVSCSLDIRMMRIAEGSPSDTRTLLAGKGMRCGLDEAQLSNGTFEDTVSLIEACHGELKEGLQELIIRRMYGEVASRISDIEAELQRTI